MPKQQPIKKFTKLFLVLAVVLFLKACGSTTVTTEQEIDYIKDLCTVSSAPSIQKEQDKVKYQLDYSPQMQLVFARSLNGNRSSVYFFTKTGDYCNFRSGYQFDSSSLLEDFQAKIKKPEKVVGVKIYWLEKSAEPPLRTSILLFKGTVKVGYTQPISLKTKEVSIGVILNSTEVDNFGIFPLKN